jgi:hypothetical protein
MDDLAKPLADVPFDVSIETPLEVASLLTTASSGRAKDFAVAMHERAAWGSDDSLAGFWLEVVSMLSGCS